MRRHLQRVIQQDDKFNLIHSAEPGVIQFRNEPMHFKIMTHPTTMQSLHLKIQPVEQYKSQWTQEELEVLERFFEAKVVCAPYKPNAFLAYGRLLNVLVKVLKDSIQLMKSEMNPDKSCKWSINWCLTIPPAAPLTMISPGMSAILVLNNTTLLLFLQLTRVSMNLPVGVDPHSTVVPFLYDMNTNVLKVADRQVPSNFLGVVNQQLKRFYEYHPLQGECSLFPAIRDIMMSDLV
jgi:mediator of RNA polymerase II transcription subunit 14